MFRRLTSLIAVLALLGVGLVPGSVQSEETGVMAAPLYAEAAPMCSLMGPGCQDVQLPTTCVGACCMAILPSAFTWRFFGEVPRRTYVARAGPLRVTHPDPGPPR